MKLETLGICIVIFKGFQPLLTTSPWGDASRVEDREGSYVCPEGLGIRLRETRSNQGLGAHGVASSALPTEDASAGSGRYNPS